MVCRRGKSAHDRGPSRGTEVALKLGNKNGRAAEKQALNAQELRNIFPSGAVTFIAKTKRWLRCSTRLRTGRSGVRLSPGAPTFRVCFLTQGAGDMGYRLYRPPCVRKHTGLPVAVSVCSASPHEVTLVESTLDSRFIAELPQRLIGDRAYDSDPLDNRMAEHGIEMIAPHKSNRRKPNTQDGRPIRRYRRRWLVERLFAWLQNFRRLITRHEYKMENYLGFVHLGCIVILMRQYF